jgi:hypothetical protein
MLTRRLMCAAELAAKLQEKGVGAEAAGEAVAYLQGLVRCRRAGGPYGCLAGRTSPSAPLPSPLHPSPPIPPPLQGLQSDEEYAEVFVRSKWRQQHKAPRMILAVGGPGGRGLGAWDGPPRPTQQRLSRPPPRQLPAPPPLPAPCRSSSAGGWRRRWPPPPCRPSLAT